MTVVLDRRALVQGSALGALAACAAPPKAAPRSADALGDRDATGIAAAIRAKEITPLEAIDAAIARAERLNPQLNAIVTPLYDRAREEAKRGIKSGPFAGAPMLVKDLNDIAGVRTTYGSRAFVSNVAKETGAYVQALLDAGFIAFGKSNTPEFGYQPTTEGLALGPCRNPWNTDHSSGGSSGGGASAAAARILPIAHANDGGGSIRIPASVCGLFGMKPSRRRMIGDGMGGEPVNLSVNHAVSVSVRDSAGLFAATERQDGPWAPVGLVTGPATKRLKIGLALQGGAGTMPDAEVEAATRAAGALCRSLGHEVREIAPPITGTEVADAFLLYWAAGAAEDYQAIARAIGRAPDASVFEPLGLGLVDYFQKNRGKLEGAVKTLQAVEARYTAAFADMDVMLTPVLSSPPPKLGVLAPTVPFETLQEVTFRYVAYTPLENVAGAPGMSVPLAWSATGLPIGAHFTAKPGGERTLFELAYELEAAQPWAKRKPPVSA